MQDILGFGKVLPIDKLIDVLSSVLGKVTKSYFDKKDIDIKAYEIKILSKAKTDAEVDKIKRISSAVNESFNQTGGIEYKVDNIVINSPKAITDLEVRTQNRIDFQTAKKQLNIERITSFAADELNKEESVIDEPLDSDWINRFFNIAEDINKEEMQALWGKILAGEIKRPNSFSLRTLELLKNLSKEEAEVFRKFAEIRLESDDTYLVHNNDGGKFLQSEFGITFHDRLLMTEIGLIASENNLELSFEPAVDDNDINHLIYGEKGIVLFRNRMSPCLGIQVLVFTKIGKELCSLIEPIFNLNYLNKICSSLNYPNVKVVYGDIHSQTDKKLNLTNKVEYGN